MAVARGRTRQRGFRRKFGRTLLSSRRKCNDRWRFDIRRRIPKRVELFRIQHHDRAAGAGVERGGIEGPIPALYRDDVPPVKAADATAPLAGGSPHEKEVSERSRTR